MKTYTITKEHIQDGRYIGARSEFDGNVVIEEGLGCVRFRRLYAKGSIVAGAGTEISVRGSVKAGYRISVKGNLTAGGLITTGGAISVEGNLTVGYRITAGGAIWVRGAIWVGWDITVGFGIWAGENITVGYRISAGDGVTAGGGVTTGLYITAKTIFSRLQITAPAAPLTTPTPDNPNPRIN